MQVLGLALVNVRSYLTMRGPCGGVGEGGELPPGAQLLGFAKALCLASVEPGVILCLHAAAEVADLCLRLLQLYLQGGCEPTKLEHLVGGGEAPRRFSVSGPHVEPTGCSPSR